MDGILAGTYLPGVKIDPKRDASEFGKFGWVMDPEGNRIELWEPPVPPKPKKEKGTRAQATKRGRK